MPSIMTHALVGVAVGLAVSRRRQPAQFWILSTLLPALPDADTLGFKFGIPYAHFFGHRGFFHSANFALLLGLVTASLFFQREKFLSPRWWSRATFFSFIIASHGVMDAFTNGGLGIALLSPFYNGRIFSPWVPIEVAPIGVSHFWGPRGMTVMRSEMFWVWLPAAGFVVAYWLASWSMRRILSESDTRNHKVQDQLEERV